MGKEWQRARKKDPYYKRAKSGGYRARSAFKLKQIQNKARLIKKGDVVVDLGAAPGGWTQVAVELADADEGKGIVVGVDLERIRPVKGATLIQGDMTQRGTVMRVLDRLHERAGGTAGRVDVVISDMSPNISGNYSMDQANSYWLAHNAMQFAEQVLKRGGHFVAKIFEGEDFPTFREELLERFNSVRTFSPPASRKESSEIYIIAKGFQGGPEPEAATDGASSDAGMEDVSTGPVDAAPRDEEE